MKHLSSKKVALMGILFALAIAFSFMESMVTPLLGLPPGVKLGLANVVVMFALFFMTWKQALLLVGLKAVFGLLTRGAVAGALSLSGGVVSLLLMVLLTLPVKKISITVISLLGAISHNMAQLFIIRLLFGQYVLFYAPILLASGVVMGILSAILLRVLIPAIEKTGMMPGGRDSDDEKKRNG